MTGDLIFSGESTHISHLPDLALGFYPTVGKNNTSKRDKLLEISSVLTMQKPSLRVNKYYSLVWLLWQQMLKV